MKTERDKLKLVNTETKISTKLLPTVKIHGIEEATKQELAECIQFVTGNLPILISINDNAEPKYRKVFVRLKNEDYCSLNRESTTRMCDIKSLRYEKFISIRMCNLRKSIGHIVGFMVELIKSYIKHKTW